MTKKNLQIIAKELNEVLGLSPEIDIDLGEKKLQKKIEEAAALLEQEDELTPRVLKFLTKMELLPWLKKEEKKEAPIQGQEDIQKPKGKKKTTSIEQAKSTPKNESKKAPKKYRSNTMAGSITDTVCGATSKNTCSELAKLLNTTPGRIWSHVSDMAKNGYQFSSLEKTNILINR